MYPSLAGKLECNISKLPCTYENSIYKNVDGSEYSGLPSQKDNIYTKQKKSPRQIESAK